MPVVETLAPTYRYLLTDLLSNVVIAELPFSGVSFGRSLNSAGSFSGSTPVILDKTNGYNVYDATMPGQTGLYVLRNNICVWGGIVWSRDYNIRSRELAVSAQEFTSYLSHRAIWKTFTGNYGASAVADNAGNYVTLTLNTGLSSGTIAPGSTVQVFFSDADTTPWDKAYVVYDQPDNKTIRLKADVAGTTVSFRQLKADVAVLTTGFKHGFKTGTRVRVSGVDDQYDGVHTVKRVLNDYSFTYKVSTKNTKTWKEVKSTGKVSPYNKITPGTYNDVTVRIRTNTQDYVESLLNATFNDFVGIEFAYANDPGVSYALSVSRYRRAGGVMEIRTEEPHDLSVGQQFTVRNLDPSINGQYEVLRIIDDTNFTYSDPGKPATAYVSVGDLQSSVKSRRLLNTKNNDGTVTATATLFTTYAHTYDEGDTVTVEGVDERNYKKAPVYDGTFTITKVNSSTSFNYVVPNNIHTKKDEKGKATGSSVTLTTTNSHYPNSTSVVYPQVVASTAGSFSPSANVGIELETQEYTGSDVSPATHRGGATDIVGSALSEYADSIAGFEYRIDCSYNADSNSFRRVFKLLSIDVPDPPAPGKVSPVSRFGADKLVFTYPGNISDLSINESAESAATRMFVTGSTAGAAGNPYYAAATATELLTPTDGSRAWPLLDAVESKSEESNQIVLYGYAERYLREARPPVAEFKVSVNGSVSPVVGTYSPGDWCSVVVDDDFVQARMNSSLEPRSTALVRKVQSYTVSVPDGVSFPETVTLDLVPEWSVDTSGN